MKQARPAGKFWMHLGLFVARVLPPRIGYAVVEQIGMLYGRLDHRLRAILESNLEPVLETSDPKRLRSVAVQVFRHFARAYYELFHLPFVPPEKIAIMANLEEPGWTQFQEHYHRGKGVIMTGIHMSSFDLGGQVILARGFPMLVLALPEEGFALINQMRAFQPGGRVLPVGPGAIREALRELRRGGILATGADRLIREQGTVVEFFGRPTLLPDGSVRLALHSGAALICSFVFRKENRYWIRLQPLELIRTGNPERDIRENVQQVARTIEPVVRTYPEQWHLLRRLWD